MQVLILCYSMYGHRARAKAVAQGVGSVDGALNRHDRSRQPQHKENQAMSQSSIDPVRRRTLLGALAAVASVPLANLVMSARLQAEELPHVSPDDPTAKALHYHDDAAAAPRADRPGAPASDQFCHNCRFVLADSGDWRPCQIFPGKAVNANGWCSSWTKK